MINWQKRLYHRIVRWWGLTFRGHYDPYFKSKDGVRYAKLPKGMILRLDGKKEAKKRQHLEGLREFFK